MKILLSIKKAFGTGQMNIRDALLPKTHWFLLKLSYIQSLSDYDLAKIELICLVGFPLMQVHIVK